MSRRRFLLPSASAFLALAALIAFACGEDDKTTDDDPPIPLPSRDGSSPGDPDGSTPTCDTNADPQNCGRCGNTCPSGPRGKAACVEGKCALACDVGFGDCNGSATDGCETDLKTKVEHCGACNRDCRSCGGSAATCNAGICDATILSNPNGKDVALLTHDDTRLVFADTSTVAQMNKDDAGAFANVYGVTNTPGILVKGNVYFINPGTEAFSGIYSTYAGFVGPQIAAFARGENAEAMAIDDTGLYYAIVTGNGVSKVLRCKDCSVPTELSPTENSLRPNAIALDATTVYFGAGDVIRRVEKTGAELRTIAIGQTPRSLAVDGEYVYWINDPPFVFPGQDAGGPKGEVARVKKGGGTVEKIVTGLTKPVILVLANDGLYVTDRGAAGAAGDGVLFRIAKNGTGRVDLAKNIALGGLTVDGTCAFFGAGSAIRRVSK